MNFYRALRFIIVTSIILVESAAGRASASTFDLPLSGTIFLQGNISAPEEITVSAVEQVGVFPAFDPTNINTLATYEFFSHFSILDRYGMVVPEPPFSIFGTTLHDFGTNCPPSLCSHTTHIALLGSLTISDMARTLLISTNILDRNVPFGLELQVNLPSDLTPTSVTPVPAALPLFVSGLAALLAIDLFRRRRAKQIPAAGAQLIAG